MKLGVEVLLQSKTLMKSLKNQRVALVCHPASVNHELQHSFDLLIKKLNLTCAFGPQHGVKGEKQDNMIESEDFLHPTAGIPIYSLYGQVRRPTPEMMQNFDVVLFDLQDLGCRIYTFITTLLYMMEECARHGKKLIVLDRPNPAGRTIEGFRLEKGWESFVGAAPLPMRHGLTVGELALYFKKHYQLALDLTVVPMRGYQPTRKKEWGWPVELTWINPSPNAANLNMARAYCGTVLLEGTCLSEGRGTTRPLEVAGAADLNFAPVLELMRKKAPQWLKGCRIREIYFQPMFQKDQGKVCHGLHIHSEGSWYRPEQFKPFRLIALLLKCVHEIYPSFEIFRNFPYEYVTDRLAFDVINGGPQLRQWIQDPTGTPGQLEKKLLIDEKSWAKESRQFRIYR